MYSPFPKDVRIKLPNRRISLRVPGSSVDRMAGLDDLDRQQRTHIAIDVVRRHCSGRDAPKLVRADLLPSILGIASLDHLPCLLNGGGNQWLDQIVQNHCEHYLLRLIPGCILRVEFQKPLRPLGIINVSVFLVWVSGDRLVVVNQIDCLIHIDVPVMMIITCGGRKGAIHRSGPGTSLACL
jgi:hypothetical protein